MPQTTLITSNSGQGRQATSLFEAALNSAGLRPDEAQYLIQRGDRMKARLREVLVELAIGCPASCEVAQEILGENFFGVADWRTHFGVTFTKSQLAQVSAFPWSDKVLTAPCPFNSNRQMKDTHFAFLGVEHLDKKRPLTIRQWQELCPAASQPCFYSYASDCWYGSEPFATDVTCQLRWYLLLKEVVPHSESNTFEEQRRMLPPEYEVPSAVAEVAKGLLCYRKTGMYLNLARYARTIDVALDGRRVSVGYFVARGLLVRRWWAGMCYDPAGLGAARKSGA